MKWLALTISFFLPLAIAHADEEFMQCWHDTDRLLIYSTPAGRLTLFQIAGPSAEVRRKLHGTRIVSTFQNGEVLRLNDYIFTYGVRATLNNKRVDGKVYECIETGIPN
jgi:hypothetical protein